ncbi:MAG: DUF1501 domain-containing protein [Planctomycetota bacterium]|nr:MAG: DUF1501 domain-containing protein [Planctomycetota bacterium]
MSSTKHVHAAGAGEVARATRRGLLRGALLGSGALVGASGLLPRVAFAGGARAARDTSGNALVFVLLRGGMDGLSLCVPHGDPDLYAARPTLAVPAPGAPSGALDLDGFFGLAPAAQRLLGAWNAGELAIVHAAGSTDPTRSHFDAFLHLELGIPNQALGALSSGWLARHLLSSAGPSPLRAAALGQTLPLSLQDAPRTLAIPDAGQFGFPGAPATAALRQQLLAAMYGANTSALHAPGVDTLAAIQLLAGIDFAGYQPAPGAAYPADSDISLGLRQCATLIKAQAGVECMVLEMGGWDLHHSLGATLGSMANLVGELSDSLAAFHTDMQGQLDRVVVVVMSEFGRHVAQNASGGLDHGHGNAMLVLGGSVVGGQVHGTWPGLAPAQLDLGDLAITTDYRDVLGEILAKHLGSTALDQVFPQHVVQFPGVLA